MGGVQPSRVKSSLFRGNAGHVFIYTLNIFNEFDRCYVNMAAEFDNCILYIFFVISCGI